MTFRIPLVSLYSGIGGLDAGFAANGFQPYFANDIDEQAQKVYEVLVGATTGGIRPHGYVVGDLSAGYADLQRDEDAVLVGGPPCQGFSRAGRMDPLDARSKHVRNFVRAVGAVSPRAFVMENVAALATNARWRPVLDGVRRAARKAGYATTALVLDAADYGVPQSRNRLFLVGVKGADRQTLRELHAPSQPTRITVREALRDVARFDDQSPDLKCAAKITPALRPVLRISPFAGMPFNGQGRFLNIDGFAPTISASLGGNHTPIVDQAWLEDPEEGGVAIRSYVDALRDGKPATISPSWRRLSVLEAACLQGFPAQVPWRGPKSVAYRQIGNAVPPPLSAEVARRLFRALEGSAAESADEIHLAA